MTGEDLKILAEEVEHNSRKLARLLGTYQETISRWEEKKGNSISLILWPWKPGKPDKKGGNMGLLVECPECKKRNSAKARLASAALPWRSFPAGFGGLNSIQEGQRKRERIGPNKAAAEQRLREVLSARTEGRYIKKSPDARTTFKELARWYLGSGRSEGQKSL